MQKDFDELLVMLTYAYNSKNPTTTLDLDTIKQCIDNFIALAPYIAETMELYPKKITKAIIRRDKKVKGSITLNEERQIKSRWTTEENEVLSNRKRHIRVKINI